MLGIVAFALAVSGGGQTLHRVLAHAPGDTADAHGCERAATSHDSDESPEPSPDEDECPVCLTLQSADRAFTSPGGFTFIDAHAFVRIERPGAETPVRAWAWSAGPPRAPPVCA